MSEKSKRVRRTFTDEFKQDAVDLVVKQGYSFKAAAEAVNVAPRSLGEGNMITRKYALWGVLTQSQQPNACRGGNPLE